MRDGRRRRRATVLAVVVGAAVVLSGCTGSGPSTGGPELKIVATLSVHADLVRAIAGDRATVTAIADAGADPAGHLPTAREQLEFATADLVVLDGGGADPWAAPILADVDAAPPVIAAADGAVPGGDGQGVEPSDALDAPTWTDPPVMIALAAALAGELARIDPDGADAYLEAAARFAGAADELETRALDARPRSVVVAAPPVLAAVIRAAGADDRTPDGLWSEGLDGAPPATDDVAVVDGDLGGPATRAAVELLERGAVGALVVPDARLAPGGSTASGELSDAAVRSGVPIATVGSAPEPGADWLAWWGALLAVAREIPAP